MVRANQHRRAVGTTRDTRLLVVPTVAFVVVAVVAALAGLSTPARAATQVNLGTAGQFAVLASSTITNTGPTTINGDVGLHPNDGSSVTGFNSVTLNGHPHYGDGVALTARNDLKTAYDAAAGQPTSATVLTQLGGATLKSGVYDSADGTFDLTGTVTLDGENTAGKVWIFKTATTLVTATDSRVVLVNGAHPCNVFWQVGSSATLGTRTAFAGNILAHTSITLDTSATITGRALAHGAAVTMDSNTISRSFCPAQVTPPPPAPSPSPSPAPAPSPTPSPTLTPVPSPTPTPAPTVSASPSEVAVPVDSTTDTDGPTSTPGAPEAPQEPEAPVAAAPPGGGTPQVPVVPTGPVPAGDGSMASDADGLPGILLLPVGAALVAAAAWRRRLA